MIGQRDWTTFLPIFWIFHFFWYFDLTLRSSATGFVRYCVGGKRIIICYCELLRCPKMNFWISNLLIQFYVFMASSAKEIYLATDWQKGTPLVINRTLVVRCHDHFFLLMNFKIVGNLVFLATGSSIRVPPFATTDQSITFTVLQT